MSLSTRRGLARNELSTNFSAADKDTKCLQEIKRRIGIAKQSFWELNECMKSNVNIKTKKMLLIINAYIISLLTYGYEAWTVSEEAARRINALETWCYLRIPKVSWISRITNKEIFDRIKDSIKADRSA